MNRDRWPVVAILAASWLICLAVALTQPLDRDEHMYQAAASFVGEASLYEDVAFFQPPYSAWMYAGWQALTPGDHVLLPARFLKALLAAGLVLGLFRLLLRLGADHLLAALLVLLLVHTGPVRVVVGAARNYDPAQLAILGAALLLPLRTGDTGGRRRWLAIGALAGVAVGFKLTYGAMALVLVAWPLLAPTAVSQRRRDLQWMLTGALLGLAPLLILVAVTDPASVRFNLVDYHLLNTEWNLREGLGRGLDVRGKLHDLRRFYRDTDLVALTAVTLLAVGLVVTRVRRRPDADPAWRLVLSLLAAAVVMVAVPRPVQQAYYVPLLLTAAMLVAAAAARIAPGRRPVLVGLAGLACLVCVIHHGSDDLRRLGGLGRPDTWPAVVVHRAGRTVAELTENQPDRPVVTLHPLYALEAGRPVERRLATGVFAWRLGDLFDSAALARHHLVTPATFIDLMDDTPASALVIVTTGPWDEPIGRWAHQAGWRPAPVGEDVLAWLPLASP